MNKMVYNNIDVSIIVPVYNKEKYLRDTLRSLQNQKGLYFEFIIIDDGSTDGSLDICKEFISIDSRFKLISIENSGVSAVRNIGVNNAIGKYIGFVDADDLIVSEMFVKLFEKAEKEMSDLSFCEYFLYQKDELIEKKLNIYNKKNYSLNVYLIRNMLSRNLMWDPNIIMGSMCRTLVKRDFILENDLFFNSELKYMEDLELVLRMLFKTQMISIINEPLYIYRLDDEKNSLSQNYNKLDLKKSIHDIFNNVNIAMNKNSNDKNYIQDSLRKWYTMHYISYLRSIASKKISYKNIKAFSKEIENKKFQKFLLEIPIASYKFKQRLILKLASNRRNIILYFIFAIFG